MVLLLGIPHTKRKGSLKDNNQAREEGQSELWPQHEEDITMMMMLMMIMGMKSKLKMMRRMEWETEELWFEQRRAEGISKAKGRWAHAPGMWDFLHTETHYSMTHDTWISFWLFSVCYGFPQALEFPPAGTDWLETPWCVYVWCVCVWMVCVFNDGLWHDQGVSSPLSLCLITVRCGSNPPLQHKLEISRAYLFLPFI